ncbi:hypothetical protein D3C87_1702010 [compost metagenome]
MERTHFIGDDSISRTCCCVSAVVPGDQVMGSLRLLWPDVDLHDLCLRDYFSDLRYLSLPMRSHVPPDGLEKTFKGQYLAHITRFSGHTDDAVPFIHITKVYAF